MKKGPRRRFALWAERGALRAGGPDRPTHDVHSGGVAKIGQSYYALVGMMGFGGNQGYSVYSFRSDDGINGTWAPDPHNFRLSGTTNGRFTHALADFALDYDTGEYLITNYMAMPNTDPKRTSLGGGGDVWLNPFRKPVIDSTGSLHLGWWEGNGKLLGEEIPLSLDALSLVANGSIGMQWLAQRSFLTGSLIY